MWADQSVGVQGLVGLLGSLGSFSLVEDHNIRDLCFNGTAYLLQKLVNREKIKIVLLISGRKDTIPSLFLLRQLLDGLHLNGHGLLK
jgi:hypothetical protein